MPRLPLACVTSVLLYILAFACLLDRPLTLGNLRARIEASLITARTIPRPKLVILAGSNGPYSHRCETIAPAIARPCLNAGVAVGIGLDYLFTRWQPLLHPGDVVYLPLEEAQYVRPRATGDLGPDAAIMLRHDRATLATMPSHRQLGALFAFDLRAAIMSVIETVLAAGNFHDPREVVTGGYNEWGDHIGHTPALAAFNRAALATITPYHPTALQIASGDGSVLVIQFLNWAKAHGVRVIGGLPTGFIDSPISDDALAAIRALYRDNGAGFLDTPGHARYPRIAFFDTQDHLHEAAQIAHSITVARCLTALMAQPPEPSR